MFMPEVIGHASPQGPRAALDRVPRQVAEDALDAVPFPSWVLRMDGTIDYANEPAEALACDGRWVRTAHGRLQRIGQVEYLSLVPDLCKAGGPGVAPAVACVVEGRLQRASLHATSIAQRRSYAAIWPHASVLLTLQRSQPGPFPGWMAAFARHHRLTAAEVRVLALLIQGHDVAAIALQLSVARSTIRTHVRVLLEKTGATRQVDLIRNVVAG